MSGVQAFLNAGGYAGFVWPSYAAVFGLLAVVTVLSLRALRRAEAEMKDVDGDGLSDGDEKEA
ncbi:MAG: heme exporter protein CcmD [Rhodospirillaceae bacterium]